MIAILTHKNNQSLLPPPSRDGDDPSVARSGQRDDRGAGLPPGAGRQQPGQHDGACAVQPEDPAQPEPLRLPAADGEAERALFVHGQRVRVPRGAGGAAGLQSQVVPGVREARTGQGTGQLWRMCVCVTPL